MKKKFSIIVILLLFSVSFVSGKNSIEYINVNFVKIVDIDVQNNINNDIIKFYSKYNYTITLNYIKIEMPPRKQSLLYYKYCLHPFVRINYKLLPQEWSNYEGSWMYVIGNKGKIRIGYDPWVTQKYGIQILPSFKWYGSSYDVTNGEFEVYIYKNKVVMYGNINGQMKILRELDYNIGEIIKIGFGGFNNLYDTKKYTRLYYVNIELVPIEIELL